MNIFKELLQKFEELIRGTAELGRLNWSNIIYQITVHSQKLTTCSGLMKTALNNVLLPTLFKVGNNSVTPDCRLVQAQQLVQYC